MQAIARSVITSIGWLLGIATSVVLRFRTRRRT